MTRFKHHIITISAVIAGCLANTIPVSAQKVTSLPADPLITAGKLPNGVNYYITPVESAGKTADFALVRRTTPALDSLAADRDFLSEHPYYGSRKPIGFFAKNGINYSRKGYLYQLPDGTVYSFTDVPTVNEAASDSLLLFINGIIAAQSAKVPTQSYAIVIAGGIDKARMTEKIKMLSLMVPPVVKEVVAEPEPEMAESAAELEPVKVKVYDSEPTKVQLEYAINNFDRKNNATVLPLITEKMNLEVAALLDARVNSYLMSRGIPFSSISTRYLGTSMVFSVYTSDEHVAEVVEGFAKMFSTAFKAGVNADEIKAAEALFYDYYRKKNRSDKAEYVSRCIDSFLTNASLSSLNSRYEYLATRVVPDSVHVRIFNRFLGETAQKQLYVNVATSSDCSEEMLSELFNRSWENPDSTFVPLSVPQISLRGAEKKDKTASLASSKDTGTGCAKFVFANGMTVYYKKIASMKDYAYKFYYPDDLSTAAKIKGKEGAYFKDMFFFRDAKYTDTDYKVFLAKHGITMTPKATLDEFSLSGRVDKRQLDTLFMLIRRLSQQNIIRQEAYSSYVSRQEVTVKAVDAAAEKTVLDSLVSPTYKYTSHKTMTGLDNLSYASAQYFYDNAMKNVSKSTLLLVGPTDEDTMNKLLEKQLSIFEKDGKKPARKKVDTGYAPKHGYNLFIGSGERRVDFQLSADVEFSTHNYYLSLLSSKVLVGELRKSIIGTGWYLTSQQSFTTVPNNRFYVRLFSSEAGEGSMESGREHITAFDAMNLCREGINTLAVTSISAAALKEYKALLIAEIDARQKDPDYWIEAMSARYIHKKDFHNKYKDRINAITASDIKEFISLLNDESVIAYIAK